MLRHIRYRPYNDYVTEISPEQGASKIVKISQQVGKLCQKLKWLLFSGTRTAYIFVTIEIPSLYQMISQNCNKIYGRGHAQHFLYKAVLSYCKSYLY